MSLNNKGSVSLRQTLSCLKLSIVALIITIKSCLFANRRNISDIKTDIQLSQLSKNLNHKRQTTKRHLELELVKLIKQYIMMEQQEQSFDMSVNETLIELQNLSKVIQSSDNQTSFKAITTFVKLYINHEKFSQQFFISLCEYNIIPRLFNPNGKLIPSLQILQTFNLLLANTSKMGQIVYIFSQPAMHDFLFYKFEIANQNCETIEYYVQLLKTIIMKFSTEKQQSLIKLFCNSRFPHFPLLTAITSLASDYQQEILTRVTANQCFLQLVNVMNETKIGIEYLSELQTIIYYHQLITNFLSQSQDQQKETIRFIVDLIYNLKKNVVSSTIFMNLLTNHILFSNIGEPYRTLHFITSLYQQMLQNKDFPVQLAQEIILVLFTIVSKYYNGTLFTNYIYYSLQKIIPTLQIPQKPNLSKFFEQRCRKIQDYLILERPLFEEQKQLEFVKEQWEHLVMNVPTFPVKQRYPRGRNRFITFFTSKEQLAADYVKAIMVKAGISDDKFDQPIYKLSVTTDYQTAMYLIQLVCIKYGLDYKLKKRKSQQKYEKDQMWMLKINQRLLIQIYRISRKIQKKQFESSRIKYQMQFHKDTCIVKAQGFIYFLQSMKKYLKNSFISLLTSMENKIEISQLTLISAISSRINLREQLDPESMRLLLNKLQELQAYISEDVFSEENFHFIIKYICKGKQKILLKKIDRNKECDYSLSPKKKFYQIRTRIQRNFILYQVIKRLIDSSVKSLSEFIQQYWRARFFSQKAGQSYPITQFLCKDANGSVLQVIANTNYEFCVKKSNKDRQSIIYSISRDDCALDSQNPTFLSFEGNQFFLDLQTQQKARNFREDLQRLRKSKAELMMNGIIEYLSFSYQCLQSYCNLKSSKMLDFTTPK